MARENQGLQIALIVFVMLTILFGVAFYVYYRKYDEAEKARAAADITAGKNETRANDNLAEATELKKLICVPTTDKIDVIKETFRKDMELYGAAYPESDRLYRPLLQKMQQTINDKNTELADAKAEVPKLRAEFEKQDAARDLQVKQFQNERDKASSDLDSERTKFQTERDRKNQDEARLAADLQAARKEAKDRLDKIDAKLQEAEANRKKLEIRNDDLAGTIERYRGGAVVGAANGEITWVNLRNSTVWINVGRADGLMRQVTFSVYPADVTRMTAEAKKGSIEVTQVLGDHLAEAHITEDDISHPILPADKVYTPLWSPGERRHFGLAGFLDIDGDGRSDLEAVKNIIAINGGVVDCYISDAGKVEGQLTVNTNCLILGKAPTDKEVDTRQVVAFTKVLKEADRLRLPKMQLGDLLQRMGWRNLTPVIRYGRGSNPKDFRAKPEAGVPKKSTGNKSDVFEKRHPPKEPASAY